MPGSASLLPGGYHKFLRGIFPSPLSPLFLATQGRTAIERILDKRLSLLYLTLARQSGWSGGEPSAARLGVR